MKVTEPAADLAIFLAIGSSASDRPVPSTTVAIGEVGLAGEIRRVSSTARRVAEAKRLGFRHAIIPAGSDEELPKGIRITKVASLADAVGALERRRLQPVDAPF
ncbi:DNA repair protein RadA, partial [Gordonia sp. HY442]